MNKKTLGILILILLAGIYIVAMSITENSEVRKSANISNLEHELSDKNNLSDEAYELNDAIVTPNNPLAISKSLILSVESVTQITLPGSVDKIITWNLKLENNGNDYTVINDSSSLDVFNIFHISDKTEDKKPKIYINDSNIGKDVAYAMWDDIPRSPCFEDGNDVENSGKLKSHCPLIIHVSILANELNFKSLRFGTEDIKLSLNGQDLKKQKQNDWFWGCNLLEQDPLEWADNKIGQYLRSKSSPELFYDIKSGVEIREYDGGRDSTPVYCKVKNVATLETREHRILARVSNMTFDSILEKSASKDYVNGSCYSNDTEALISGNAHLDCYNQICGYAKILLQIKPEDAHGKAYDILNDSCFLNQHQKIEKQNSSEAE